MPRSHIHSLTFVTELVGVAFVLLGVGDASGMDTPDADISQIHAAAEQGRVHDEIALGDAYFTGRGVHQNLTLAAFWYEKAAGSGDPVAQNQIGYIYQAGLGVAPDNARAVHWFQLAASNGFVDAKVNLGVAYLWGAGATRNPELALRLIREAADKGSAIGAAYLGEMYAYGVGVAKDYAAAEQWYERGAKRHNSLAVFRLGRIMSGEEGHHPPDLKRAVSLYREAVAAGFVPAMHSLGVLLVNHPELNCSKDEGAVSLLNRSADAGTWKSSVVLGLLSRDGRMVPQDDKAAYFHFQVAIQQGGERARNLVSNDLRAVAAKLEADQRQRIDQEVRSWTQKHDVTLEVIYKNGEHLAPFPAFGLEAPPANVHAGALVPTNPF